MGKKYTVEEFTRWLHKFPARIQAEALKAWDRQTMDIQGDAAQRTPLVSGDLQGSGRNIKAKVTPHGILSYIVFGMPYASVIESGMRNGKPIHLRPVGYQYKHHKKDRLGEIGFLTKAGKAGHQGLVDTMEAVIDKVWNAS